MSVSVQCITCDRYFYLFDEQGCYVRLPGGQIACNRCYDIYKKITAVYRNNKGAKHES
jgi:hypothetical protein